MNPLNYATLEASKSLVDAGIVLETEKAWLLSTIGWQLVDNIKYYGFWKNAEKIPAPSMAEVWRELPSKRGDYYKNLSVHSDDNGVNVACYSDDNGTAENWSIKENTNPIDALIDLLIWVTEHKEERRKP